MRKIKRGSLCCFLLPVLMLLLPWQVQAKKLSGLEYDGLPARYARLNSAMDDLLEESESASGRAALRYEAYGLTKKEAADYIKNYLESNTLLKYDPWFSFGAVHGAYDAPNLRWAVRPQIFIEGDQIILRRSRNVKKLIRRCRESKALCRSYAKKNAVVRDLISGGYSTKAFSKKLSAFLYEKIPYRLNKNVYSGPLAFFKRKKGDCTCVASLFIIFGRMAGADCYITWDGFHATAVIINGPDRFLVDVTQQTLSDEIDSWIPQERRAKLDMQLHEESSRSRLQHFQTAEDSPEEDPSPQETANEQESGDLKLEESA